MDHGAGFRLLESLGRFKSRGARVVGEPGPETRFEAGYVVVVLGEPDSLAAAETRLLQG